MSCIYSNYRPSYCQLGYDPDTGEADTDNYPIDENGICNVEDDEFPGDSCGDFSAGFGYCSRCGNPCCDCMCGDLGDAELCDDCADNADFD